MQFGIWFYIVKAPLLRELTDDSEVNEIAAYWLRVDLTFVDACIPFLSPLDLQRPFFIVSVMVGLKALVTRVGIAPHGEDVNVSVSDP
jgi:hypothetical protein